MCENPFLYILLLSVRLILVPGHILAACNQAARTMFSFCSFAAVPLSLFPLLRLSAFLH
jgi:hypothetical protein